MTRQSLYKQKRKAEGKCTNCGKRKLFSKALCKICLKVNAERIKMHRAKKSCCKLD